MKDEDYVPHEVVGKIVAGATLCRAWRESAILILKRGRVEIDKKISTRQKTIYPLSLKE